MEVVAAISSAAGIATLVRQSLSNLSSLYNFFKDCRDASKTVDRFLIAVKSLERTIRNVESLLQSIKCIPEAPAESNLASLTVHVEDCKKDIEIWVREARSSRPGIGPGATSVFRKFPVVVRKQSIKDVFREMAAHKESISLSLIATGRSVHGVIAS